MTDPAQPYLVVVDIYGNGYDNPPTQTGVQTLPMDPTNLPTTGAHVAVAMVDQQQYSLPVGGGSSGYPAIVMAAGYVSGQWIFQVDIYANGLPPASPTQTSVTATAIDLNTLSFSIGDHVTVIKAGTNYYVVSSKPYAPVAAKPNILATIGTYTGSGGVYPVTETTVPGGSPLPGGYTGNATEATGSAYIPYGQPVICTWINGAYYFNLPFGP